jgi:signal transduction histidine kinase
VFGQAAGEQTIVIDFSLLPVKDQDGSVVFLLAEGRNITEKKRAEAEIARKSEELQKLLDKLRQADQLKSDFFANISHELRTPLALILGPVEVMLSGADNLTEPQRRDLNVIHRNAATLLGHVNDLLDLAKHDAGKMVPSYFPAQKSRMALAPRPSVSSRRRSAGLAWKRRAAPPVTGGRLAVTLRRTQVRSCQPDAGESITLAMLMRQSAITPSPTHRCMPEGPL